MYGMKSKRNAIRDWSGQHNSIGGADVAWAMVCAAAGRAPSEFIPGTSIESAVSIADALGRDPAGNVSMASFCESERRDALS